jgi:FemAB-related protein (PEP-CTERM system-associated)
MIATMPDLPKAAAPRMLAIRVYSGRDLNLCLPAFERYLRQHGALPLSRHPAWLRVLEQGLGHTCYGIEAVEGEQIRGVLPLAYVSSFLFGRFLVSLPYLNYGGVRADDAETAALLIDEAVRLADRLSVRYLELRDEQPLEHPRLAQRMSTKVHMRLPLPGQSDILWKALSAKVRNQVRKGEKSQLTVAWGGIERLPEFYAVFSRNMRDLGTPAYGKRLFKSILAEFPDRAELCVVKAAETPIAGALLLHGWGVTEVPSASSLRSHNHTCANMLMYWHLLRRAIERGQTTFDFGRSTRDSSTYRFKEQWGAKEAAAEWQYYVRRGTIGDMRPDNPRYQRMIRIWQRLPVALTRWLGPRIVRGIP